jgi:hypothetical protein
MFNRKILLIGIIVTVFLLTQIVSAKPAINKAQGSGTEYYYDEDDGVTYGYQYTFSVKQLDDEYNGKGVFNITTWTMENPADVNYYMKCKADYVRIEGNRAIFSGFITDSTVGPGYAGQIGHYLGFYATDNSPDRVTAVLSNDKETVISSLIYWLEDNTVQPPLGQGHIKIV